MIRHGFLALADFRLGLYERAGYAECWAASL